MRKILLGVILVLLAGLFWTISGHYRKAVAPVPVKTPESKDDLQLDKIDYSENRAGKRVWRLRAETGGYRIEGEQGRLKQVRLTVFQQQGWGDLQLQAERGTWLQQQKKLQLEGNVHLQSETGYAFRSAKADFSTASGRLQVPGAVWLKTPQMELRGQGLDLDSHSGRLRVLKQVQATFNSLQLDKRK